MMATNRFRKRLFSILLGIGISTLFLWIAVKDVDIASLKSALSGAILWYAAPLLLSLLLFYWLKAVRWAALLKPIQQLTARQVLPTLMVGFAGNNLLPAHAGELIRVYLLGRQYQLSKSAILASVILERLLDIIAVLLLVATALYASSRIHPGLMYGAYLASVITILALLLIIIYVCKTRQSIALLERLMAGWMKQAWLHKLLEQLEVAANGLKIVRQPAAFFKALINSIIQWLAMVLCIFIAISALQIQVPLSASILVLGLIVAGVSLPSAPGFFGTIELCFVLGLKPYGIDAAQAFSAGIFFHILAYVSVTVTGLIYLHHFGESFNKIKNAAETSD